MEKKSRDRVQTVGLRKKISRLLSAPVASLNACVIQVVQDEIR